MQNGHAAELLRLVPLGRIAWPEEVATSVVYPASDDSSYVTGADLSNDGGASQV